MALINCAQCTAQISDQAPACIKCGAPITKMAQAPIKPATTTTKKKQSTIVLIGKVLLGICFVLILIGRITSFLHRSSSTADADFAFTPVPLPPTAQLLGAETDSDITDNDLDIATARAMLHEISFMERFNNMQDERLSRNIAELKESDISQERKGALVDDIKDIASKAEYDSKDAMNIKAAHMQNSEANDFAAKAVAAKQSRDADYLQYTRAVLQSDPAETKRLAQLVADDKAKEIEAFKNMSHALGTTSDNILQPWDKAMNWPPMKRTQAGSDIETLKPAFRMMVELERDVMGVARLIENDFSELKQNGSSPDKVAALNADLQLQLSRINYLADESKLYADQKFTDTSVRHPYENLKREQFEWVVAVRSKLEAEQQGDAKNTQFADKWIGEQKVKEVQLINTITQELGTEFKDFIN